ncbi:MAG: transposase [Pseudomonadota bacterium]
MTLAQQLEQKGLQQGLQQGRKEEALAIAKNLLAEGISSQAVQRLTGLSEKEVMELA